MARSFSAVKIMSALVSDGFRNALFIRRGYAAVAADRVVAKSGSKTKKEEAERSTEEKMAWVPDPVTGYYRPENCADEIDPVDLRAMLLKPRRKIVN
ncbi:late embryogenis abundant protein 2-like [Momordica charantia]|uniref:Late embryogenis abundant protein 2-like n=1 Tax=Momordica charantia TaxID=3673 RepID=A0A6J1DM52_MOMCH|nr:late embryogenis abundant protein 2-like [Momordica charantia]